MTLRIFDHPTQPHVRRHGPQGYNPYSGYKQWLRDEFQFRCVYCLERERWYPNGHASFSADHVIPQSEDPSRICDYTNLVYACTRCNSLRRNLGLLDPTAFAFGDHMGLNSDALFVSLTSEGKDVIDTLRLNKNPALRVRRKMLRIQTLYASAPNNEDAKALYFEAFGYPEDLPDLTLAKPPTGNSLPQGVLACYFVQRREEQLPEVY